MEKRKRGLADVFGKVKNYAKEKSASEKVTLHDVDEPSGRMMWRYTTPEGKTFFSDSRDDLVGIAVMHEMRAKARSKLGGVL